MVFKLLNITIFKVRLGAKSTTRYAYLPKPFHLHLGKPNAHPGPLFHPQTPPPGRRRRHSHFPRPHRLHPYRSSRSHQDSISRQTRPRPLPLSPAHLALHGRPFLLRTVLQTPVCGRGRVRAVATNCVFEAKTEMEVRATQYFC